MFLTLKMLIKLDQKKFPNLCLTLKMSSDMWCETPKIYVKKKNASTILCIFS